MKTKLIATILLLVIIAFLFASEDATEQEEYFRKKQELDLLAERFKAETGFTGEIQYSYEHMSLGVFEGRFAGITISSEADTTAFRAAFNQILNKVLPYSKATKNQLKACKIRSKWGSTETDYYQVVNGYGVEGAGWIGVEYDSGRNRFAVSNNAVDLPSTGTNPVLKFEDAVRIYDENVFDDETTKSFRKRRPFLTLFFSNIYNDWEGDTRSEYRLCWVGGYTKCIYIDALTGQVYKIVDKTMDDYTVNVSAEVMLNSDNSASFSTTFVPLDSTWVQAVCDSIPIPVTDYTGSNGYYNFQCNTISDIESYLSSACGIEVRQNNNNSVMHNSLISCLPNLSFDYSNIQGNPSNLYYHALRFRDKIKSLITLSSSSCFYDSTFIEPIVLANCSLGPNVNGSYTPNTGNSGEIKVTAGNGNYSSTLCHEMTHDMVYRSLRYNIFRHGSTQELRGAMDEAFSSYFPCMHRNNKYYRSQYYTKDLDDTLLTVANIQSSEYTSLPVDEDIYNCYHMRFPLASAWWSLRNNQLFGDLTTDINAADTLLVRALGVVKRELPNNSTYRYKPRYFYNILMKLVDTDSESLPLNAKQLAIDAAYSSRGFKFNPKVESISEANSSRNIFGLNEPVHVKISDCPQNTRINIYVIKHGTYTYTDGAIVTGLSNFYAHGFTPITNVTTSPTGEWSGLIWTTPSSAADAVGDYDIIVDIGSPTTPDGKIHYAFSAANVMDGFDGRTAPGFKVTDKNINLVIAMDLSTSIQENVLGQVVKNGQERGNSGSSGFFFEG